jgi:hypothetical protein
LGVKQECFSIHKIEIIFAKTARSAYLSKDSPTFITVRIALARVFAIGPKR